MLIVKPSIVPTRVCKVSLTFLVYSIRSHICYGTEIENTKGKVCKKYEGAMSKDRKDDRKKKTKTKIKFTHIYIS